MALRDIEWEYGARRFINLGHRPASVMKGAGTPPETTAPTGSPKITVENTKLIAEGTNGDGWYGRTAFAVLNGIVILTYREATSHPVNDGGKLHIRFSDDYGETWSDEDKYLDASSVTNFPWRPASYLATEGPGEPWLIIAPNDDVYVYGWQIDYGVTRGGTWHSKSTDGGKTFSTPANITDSITGLGSLDSDRVFMSNDHFIVDDTVYLSAWASDVTGTISILLKSTDNCASWSFVSKITDNASDPYTETYEAGLLYIGDNTIITLMRNGANSGTLHRISTDMGLTWGTLTDVSSKWSVTARHRFRQRSRLKGTDDWWLDPLVYTSVFEHDDPGNSHPRRNSILVSKDSGTTFPYILPLDTAYEDGGYNDIFYNPTLDQYVVMGYRGLLTDGDVVQYNFSVDWAVPTVLYSDNFANLDNWTESGDNTANWSSGVSSNRLQLGISADVSAATLDLLTFNNTLNEDITVSINLESQTAYSSDDPQFYFGLWKNTPTTSDRAIWGSRSANFRAFVVNGGSTQMDETIARSASKRFKIVYSKATTTVWMKYWDGTQWIVLESGHTIDLGDNFKVAFWMYASGIVGPVDGGTPIYYEDFYVTDIDYNTELPT